jgi:IS5 family transposase
MDPRLRRIDEVLEDDALLDGVMAAMRARFPQSGRRGRRGTPAEVVLRMLVLKHLKNWSYEQLEWEVKGNLVYRHFCRIDAGKVPDAKTMVRLGQLLEGPALRGVFERVVEMAVERRATKGRKLRVDTTVVETPIRYPSDSRLCEDVTQGACREIERLRSAGVTAPRGFRNVRRSVTRRVREITHVSRRPIAREAKRRALQRPYRRLLAITRRTIRQAAQTVKRAKRRPYLSGRHRRSVRNLGRLVRLGKRGVEQTKERVFKGNAKSREKLVSIFEPQTKILRRGKAGKPTEFGQMVKVQEASSPMSPCRRRACVVGGRRGAHRAAQEHLRDEPDSLQRRPWRGARRALGRHREQPDGDRGRGMSPRGGTGATPRDFRPGSHQGPPHQNRSIRRPEPSGHRRERLRHLEFCTAV